MDDSIKNSIFQSVQFEVVELRELVEILHQKLKAESDATRVVESIQDQLEKVQRGSNFFLIRG